MGKVTSKLNGNYYVGTDIGTDSVGWAVTDDTYKLIKEKGKAMWGIRLVDGAQTAVERRTSRGTRRRLDRQRQRIALLEELFAKEIGKVDAGFFQRMKESKLFEEDKQVDQPFTLFSDKEYTDRAYHQQYPTIYHLRKALIDGQISDDPRLLYIGLHHIIKNRGHFIFEGNVEAATSFTTVYEQFINAMRDELGVEMSCDSQEMVAQLLRNREIKGRQKKDRLVELFGISKKDKQLMAVISLIVGLSAKLSEVFLEPGLEELEKKTICFSDTSYEEAYVGLEEILPEKCYVIDVLKGLYDWALLADLLRDEANPEGTAKYLSYAKVNQYDKHKRDLECLKSIFKDIGGQAYKEMFRDVKVKDNYCAYIGSCKVNGKKESIKRCKKEDFYKYTMNTLKKLEGKCTTSKDEELLCYIKAEIEKQTFLPLQVTKNNGVIPHQIHLLELDMILEQARGQFTFLNEKDENELSVSDKIRSIFLFRVPYYVGPLNDAHKDKGGNCWVVKRENVPIKPWNIKEVVDIDASAEQFIKRMTNKCTYLVGEDVLPKNSLLYAEYMVLNELNNIKVKGELLSVPIKQLALEKLFKKERNVTRNKFYKFLRAEGYELVIDDITGIEDKFLASLTSYHDFRKKVFKEQLEEYKYTVMAEDIIRYCTIYGDDKKMLTRVLRNRFGEALTDEQLKAIRSLHYVGWGRLSEKFLRGIQGVQCETGECFNIMNALKETTDNLMQLLSSQYSFVEVIEKYNSELQQEITEISYETLVKDLPIAPAVKRVTWQTISIVEEIKKVLGKAPAKIFIEVAKGPEEKIRTMSRKDQLMKLYANCKEEARDWKKELENKSESDFRSIKLYLYYTQKGKCMYTGEDIQLSELANTNIYDKDHIYPRSKTKDDSLDNLVLVKKKENSEKDNDIVSPEIQAKMQPYWQSLKQGGFISQEKYNRLTRKTPLTPEELAGFINRQLVETRQSTKVIAALMKRLNPQSEIVYVKAKLVSEFRQKELEIIKSRTINDLHHAKDAYLNIVVGNVYHTKFTSNPLMWLKKNETPKYSLNQMFKENLYKGKQCVWQRGNKGTKEVIKAVMRKNNILYTRYATCNKGELFNKQIVSPKENPTVPVKRGLDVKKYGGYKSITPAYFALIESYDKKGKLQRTIESIPLYLEQVFREHPEELIQYCESNYELKSPRIIIPCIKKNALFKVNGFLMHLRGTTGQQLIFQGAVQLCMNAEEEQYIKKVEKYIALNLERTDKKANLLITEYDKLTKEANLKLYDALICKHANTIYQYKPANQVNTLREKRVLFEALCVEEQCILLGEVLHLFQCKPIAANLSLVGGGKNSGGIKISKKISSAQEAYLIHQSITGLYEQIVDLLTI